MSKFRLLIIFLLCYLVPIVTYIYAQNEATWPIVERCIEETSSLDKGFSGTILASDSLGIHGVNSTWDTPRLIVPRNEHWHDFYVGSLSPDGLWYAVVFGNSDSDSTLYISITINALAIYSTVDEGISYIYPWDVNYLIPPITGSGRYWYMPDIKWWDKDHILYLQHGFIDIERNYAEPLAKINIYDGLAELMPQGYDVNLLLGESISSESPDWTRLVFQPIAMPYARLWYTATTEIIPTEYEDDDIHLVRAAWNPDSSNFVGTYTNDNKTGLQESALVLVNTNGVIENLVYLNQPDSNPFLMTESNTSWSPDGRFLVLTGHQFVIADMMTKTLIATCLDSPQSFTWSPDSSMLAYVPFDTNDEESTLQILDVQHWYSYSIDYHLTYLIGWRDDHD